MSFASGGLFLALPGFAVGGAEPLVSDIPLLRTKGKLTWVARKPHSSRLPCVRLHLFCCHGQHHKFGSLRAFAVMPLTLLTADVPPRFVAAKSATLRPVQKSTGHPPASLRLLSAKSHACIFCSFVNALTTKMLRYQLFAVIADRFVAACPRLARALRSLRSPHSSFIKN
jgi:hypothetical protein